MYLRIEVHFFFEDLRLVRGILFDNENEKKKNVLLSLYLYLAIKLPLKRFSL